MSRAAGQRVPVTKAKGRRMRRADLVGGYDELGTPASNRPAAVRITDKLGEEILAVGQRA